MFMENGPIMAKLLAIKVFHLSLVLCITFLDDFRSSWLWSRKFSLVAYMRFETSFVLNAKVEVTLLQMTGYDR
jgi:hypothetical protein